MTTIDSVRRYDLYSEWPFFDDNVKTRVYNSKGNIAVVIGRVEKDPPLSHMLELIPKDFPLDHVAIIGTVWTLKRGIERIVQNLITNPYIDTVILCGDDSKVFYPLSGLFCLKEFGVDESKHINGYLSLQNKRVFARDALVDLSHRDIDYFREKKIQMVNMIGHSRKPEIIFKELRKTIPSLEHEVEDPSCDFLEKLDIYSWKEGRIIRAKDSLPRDLISKVKIDIQSNIDRSEVRVLYYARNGKSVAISARPASVDSTQAVIDTFINKKVDDEVFGNDHLVAYIASGIERAFLSLSYPQIYEKIRDRFIVPFTIRNDSMSNDYEFKAKRARILTDPNGYFEIGVDYEENNINVNYIKIPDETKEATIQGENAESLLEAIINRNYIGTYEGRLQHIAYLAVQLECAAFAISSGVAYDQDMPIQPVNVKNINHHLNTGVLIEGATLEEAWVKGLANLRNYGLITTTQKGRVAENWGTLFHLSGVEKISIPELYPFTEEDVCRYEEELFRAAPDDTDTYTYGDRECHHWYDQISNVIERLKNNCNMAHVTQRWDPLIDWKLDHAPCLVFSIWFIQDGFLNTFQVVRSHDIYGGMPMNALGIARGWGRRIAEALNIGMGDLVFSSISNNYRIADSAKEVRKVINRGTIEKREFIPHMNKLFIVSTSSLEEASKDLKEFVLEYRTRMLFPSIFINKIDEKCRILDKETIEDTLAGKNIVGQRLRNYHQVDQILCASNHLRERTEAGDRTNKVVLTPRDPILDRHRESTDLLMIQLRYQLGSLHAGAVFVNSSFTDFSKHISCVYGIQRHVAELTGSPIGSTFVQYAPMLKLQ